jgi:hypothetical protein
MTTPGSAAPRTGWQTLIADLSIILFMVTAGSLAKVAPPNAVKPAAAMPAPAMARPLAVWRAEPGGPPLGAWLAAQPRDPRQQLTIVVRYDHTGEDALAARIAALLAATNRAGVRTRIVAEPGPPETTAGLAFDAGPPV